MDSQCLDNLLEEVAVAIPPLQEILEGLDDYINSDLQPATKTEVQALFNEYQHRLNLLNALQAGLETAVSQVAALLADGHPQLRIMEISEGSMADITENLITREAAHRQFRKRMLTVSGKLSAGEETQQ